MKLKLIVAVALLAGVLYGLSGAYSSLEEWTRVESVAAAGK